MKTVRPSSATRGMKQSWGDITERIKRRLRNKGVNCVAVDGGVTQFGLFTVMIEIVNGEQKVRMPALVNPDDVERDIRRYIRFFAKHEADLFHKL